MKEYTVTFNAEVTAIIQIDGDITNTLRSDLYRDAQEAIILNTDPTYNDVHIRDLKVFISKEDCD